jgi:hypothetical protein
VRLVCTDPLHAGRFRLTEVELVEQIWIERRDLSLARDVDLAARLGHRKLLLAEQLLQVAFEFEDSSPAECQTSAE